MPIIDVQSNDADFQLLVQQTEALLSPERSHKEMATGGAVLTRNHLLALSNARDHGGRFYESYADVTVPEWSNAEALVVIPAVVNKKASKPRGNPLAAHFFGADILPSGTTSAITGKAIKHLSIPANEQARHLGAGDFQNLTPVFSKKSGSVKVVALALKQAEPEGHLEKKRLRGIRGLVRAAKKQGKLAIMFWLVDSVKLKGGEGVGDKTVLPTEQQYVDAAIYSLINLLARGGNN